MISKMFAREKIVARSASESSAAREKIVARSASESSAARAKRSPTTVIDIRAPWARPS